MNNKLLIFVSTILVGLSCLGNAVYYFISGEQYRNTDLRSYAVVGQILFALAVVAYGFWDYKTSSDKIDQ